MLLITHILRLTSYDNCSVRFDDYLEGFESLWESEKQNLSLDEKRESIRNERATLNFLGLVRESSNNADSTRILLTDSLRIHAKTIGQNWVAGMTCPAGESVVVPLSRVRAVLAAKPCECVPNRIASHPLVPIGALLRSYERSGANLQLSFAVSIFSGRVVAVFRDAVAFATSDSQLLIPFPTIESISVLGS